MASEHPPSNCNGTNHPQTATTSSHSNGEEIPTIAATATTAAAFVSEAAATTHVAQNEY